MHRINADDFVPINCQDGKIRARRSALERYRALYGARSSFSGGLEAIELHLPVRVAEQIVAWAERHINDSNQFDNRLSTNFSIKLTPEDENQLRHLDNFTLYKVIQTADEYILPDLLDGACQIAARALERADPMDIRNDFFGGESGFTEEEENQLRRENEWIEEL